MENLTACQTYSNSKFEKIYFCDENNNIKKVITFCKAKNLLDAIN